MAAAEDMDRGAAFDFRATLDVAILASGETKPDPVEEKAEDPTASMTSAKSTNRTSCIMKTIVFYVCCVDFIIFPKARTVIVMLQSANQSTVRLYILYADSDFGCNPFVCC